MAEILRSEFSQIVDSAIEEISKELRDLSLQIHSHPEISSQERFAHKILTDYLQSKGFTITRHAYNLETAFRAEFVNELDQDPHISRKRPVVSFNSEYDALPGIGHGCGHNLIAISGVAAAYGVSIEISSVMSVIKSKNIAGKVVLFGTPAEGDAFENVHSEIARGKSKLIQAGAYKDVDICIMLHPGWVDTLDPVYVACQILWVEYVGKPAHAAGKNALDAAVLAYNALSLLRQQILPTDRSLVIPARTTVQYMIRSKYISQLRELRPRVEACFTAAASATSCDISIKWESECFDVLVNHTLADRFKKYMIERGVEYPNVPTSGGSTDMGNVSYEVPGFHARYNIGTENMIHTPEFAKDAKTEEAHIRTVRAAKCLALTALDALVDDEFYQKAHDEFWKVKPNL
ncbi:hypothetical protein G9A89_002331 [Geosiphon pyriformis]|nr:hypothetical protein G9A89_002331 [Geosiphon pyriformis]